MKSEKYDPKTRETLDQFTKASRQPQEHTKEEPYPPEVLEKQKRLGDEIIDKTRSRRVAQDRLSGQAGTGQKGKSSEAEGPKKENVRKKLGDSRNKI